VLEYLSQIPGVDIHCASHTKMGALSMAAYEGHTEAVRLLLQVAMMSSIKEPHTAKSSEKSPQNVRGAHRGGAPAAPGRYDDIYM